MKKELSGSPPYQSFYQCPVCHRTEQFSGGEGPIYPPYGMMPPMMLPGAYPPMQPGIACPCCQFPPNPRMEELSKYFGVCTNPMPPDMAYPCGPYVEPRPFYPPKKEDRRKAKKKAAKREKGYTKKARKEEIKRRIRFVDRTANKLLNSPCMSFEDTDYCEEDCYPTRNCCYKTFPPEPCCPDPCAPQTTCCNQESLTEKVDRLACQIEKLVKFLCAEKKEKKSTTKETPKEKDKSIISHFFPAQGDETVYPVFTEPYYFTDAYEVDKKRKRRKPKNYRLDSDRNDRKEIQVFKMPFDNEKMKKCDRKVYRRIAEDKRNRYTSTTSVPTETEVVYREKRKDRKIL